MIQKSFLIALLILNYSISRVSCYISLHQKCLKVNFDRPLDRSNFEESMSTKLSRGYFLGKRRILKPLQIDVFGLGFTEFLVIIAAGVILFGPDQLRETLKDKGKNEKKDSISDKGQEIRNRQVEAKERRNARSWQRINEAIENNDSDVLAKLNDLRKRGYLNDNSKAS
jgi:Sec-independent protein translocase protein TatA